MSGIVVRPVRFTEQIEAMQAFLETLGLRPRIESEGGFGGALAVCALAGERLVFMKFDDHGRLLWTRTPPALRGSYGRLRSVVQTADHDLLITTANGGGVDKIVRVSPVGG